MDAPEFEIAGRKIGAGHPAYIIAELSANHNQDYETAVAIVHAAADAGADAIKLQTYTADTITIDCDNEHFQIRKGTLWEGKVLHALYQEAYTPWEWQPKLMAEAKARGLHCFSSPFDPTAVDFLESLAVPAYKLASFELIDIPLIRKIASTGKPLIMSTGMATLDEIDEAVRIARAAGARSISLLRTNSGYPASPAEINLRCMANLADTFSVVTGLSDHTLGIAVPVAAVALGASIIEKHFTLSRAVPGPDVAFSLEPAEFRAMVEAVRTAEQAVGRVQYGPTERELASRQFRRSLFVVKNVKKGEVFTSENVRSIRPAAGLHTRHLEVVLGRRAARDAEKGTPMSWDLLA
ncbi:MAG TPA: pseudaminic acid synthase [Polyangiales bacterium]